MSKRKITKTAGYGLPEPLKKLAKEMRTNHQYRADELLDYFLDDILGSFGVPLPRPCPKELHQMMFDLTSGYGEFLFNNSEFADHLGQLYMELAQGNSALGQFFTPYDLCRLMASITNTGAWAELNERVVYVNEPCSGAGAMMLATIQSIEEEQGLKALENLSITTIDLDPLCCKMTAVQILTNLLVRNASLGELKVYHGNTLKDPTDWRLMLHATHKDFAEKVKGSRHMPSVAREKAPAFLSNDQLVLF